MFLRGRTKLMFTKADVVSEVISWSTFIVAVVPDVINTRGCHHKGFFTSRQYLTHSLCVCGVSLYYRWNITTYFRFMMYFDLGFLVFPQYIPTLCWNLFIFNINWINFPPNNSQLMFYTVYLLNTVKTTSLRHNERHSFTESKAILHDWLQRLLNDHKMAARPNYSQSSIELKSVKCVIWIRSEKT